MAVTCSLLNPIFRESQQDWIASGTYTVAGASIFARPDAVSLDYQTAFSYGPVETGSADTGLVAKAWRIHNTWTNSTGTVFLTREHDNGKQWRNDLPLFNYNGVNIDEIDLTFATDGRAIVCASRKTGPSNAVSGSQVWLYWFSPSIGNFTFQNFGTGSTPRLVCDAPEFASAADVLLFYVKDDYGHVKYRQQRDQYAIERDVPLPVPISVNGTLNGALSGTLVGTYSGTFQGTVTGWTLATPLYGSLVGTSSAPSTGLLSGELLPNAVTFTGSLFGGFTGSLSGTLSGTVGGAPFTGTGSAISGILFGAASGAFSGSGLADVYRTRTFVASGSFTNLQASGWVTGSYTGDSSPSFGSGSISGYMSGALSGAMLGDVYGQPTGALQTFFDLYLEDVVKLRDSRVEIYYGVHNRLNAEYVVKRWQTSLYPIRMDSESIAIGMSFLSGTMYNAVMTHSVYDTDALISMSAVPTTLSLFDVVVTQSIPWNSSDAFAPFTSSLMSWSLIDVVRPFDFPWDASDAFTRFKSSFITASLPTVVIEPHIFNGDDAFVSASLTLVSGSLV